MPRRRGGRPASGPAPCTNSASTDRLSILWHQYSILSEVHCVTTANELRPCTEPAPLWAGLLQPAESQQRIVSRLAHDDRDAAAGAAGRHCTSLYIDRIRTRDDASVPHCSYS